MGAVGGVIVGVIMVTGFREREPGYGGKKLSEWLTVIGATNSSDSDRVEAKDAVRRIGTNALPCLVKWVGYEQPAWKRRLLDKYARWPEPFFNNSIAQWLMGSKGEMLAGDATLGFSAWVLMLSRRSAGETNAWRYDKVQAKESRGRCKFNFNT